MFNEIGQNEGPRSRYAEGSGTDGAQHHVVQVMTIGIKAARSRPGVIFCASTIEIVLVSGLRARPAQIDHYLTLPQRLSCSFEIPLTPAGRVGRSKVPARMMRMAVPTRVDDGQVLPTVLNDHRAILLLELDWTVKPSRVCGYSVRPAEASHRTVESQPNSVIQPELRPSAAGMVFPCSCPAGV